MSLSLARVSYGVALPQGPAVFETSLQSRISSTDTSMTLVANSVRGSSTLSGYNCFTIDEGRTDMEYVCGTISGTAVSSLERGIDPLTGTTTNSTLKFAHRVGANVKVTDFPLIQRLRNLANAVEHFPNLLAYATTTTLCTVSSSNYTLCDKAYTDSRVSAGAAAANETTQGLVELATGSEMASSTSLGSTAARLAIPADRATSTPQSCTLNPCAITTRYGLNKVWQGVLDLTEHFVFSSLFATNASTTNATTTTSWGLGSVSYRPPQAAPSASSTILGVSGTSPYQLSWITPPVTTLAVDNASNGTAATATTTVKTLTIAGGTMGLNDSLSLKTTWGITANSVGASCFHTILVGNGSATTTLMNDFSQQLPSFANFDITNKASLSSQFIHGMKAGTTVTSLDPASGATTTAYNTASNIYIAFQSRTANASQSCGMQTMLVQLIKS